MKRINIISLIAVIIIICGFGLRGKISGEKFNSKKWKTADLTSENNFSLRWDIGKPDEGFTTENTFRYSLGYTYTGINTGSLVVTFDNGIVSGISWQG